MLVLLNGYDYNAVRYFFILKFTTHWFCDSSTRLNRRGNFNAIRCKVFQEYV
jgi:hypothetical protein